MSDYHAVYLRYRVPGHQSLRETIALVDTGVPFVSVLPFSSSEYCLQLKYWETACLNAHLERKVHPRGGPIRCSWISHVWNSPQSDFISFSRRDSFRLVVNFACLEYTFSWFNLKTPWFLIGHCFSSDTTPCSHPHEVPRLGICMIRFSMGRSCLWESAFCKEICPMYLHFQGVLYQSNPLHFLLCHAVFLLNSNFLDVTFQLSWKSAIPLFRFAPWTWKISRKLATEILQSAWGRRFLDIMHCPHGVKDFFSESLLKSCRVGSYLMSAWFRTIERFESVDASRVELLGVRRRRLSS